MSEPLIVQIHATRPDAVIPKYATEGSAGFDLVSAESKVVAPGEIALVSTGLVVAVPRGYFLAIIARSSTPKRHGLDLPHAIGVLDSDYRGPEDEVLIQVRNFSTSNAWVWAGERLAQGIILAAPRVEWQVLMPTAPSRGGVGSTGR